MKVTKIKTKKINRSTQLILMFVVIASMTLFSACSSDQNSTASETQNTTQEVVQNETTSVTESEAESESPSESLPVFTAEELAKYNGKSGNPAYIAYKGKVYDVTNIKAWKGGIHQNEFEAGKDYTDILNNKAPHSAKNLTDNAPVVGTYE